MWRMRLAPAWVAAVVVPALLASGGCRYRADVVFPPEPPGSSLVLFADGSVLTELHGPERREPVRWADLPPALPRAVVAIEDTRFWDHGGVDARGVARALVRDVSAGAAREGGSTITQQYVRAAMLPPDLGRRRTLERKVREAVLAVQLERRYPKRAILVRYLNAMYFGHGAYGVGAASRRYFGRPVRELGLHESALLAGIIRSPSAYDPHRHPEAARARRDEVLDRMEELGWASGPEVAAAKAAPLGVRPLVEPPVPARHFVAAVRRFVLANDALAPTRDQRRRLLLEGGLRIHTTLDATWQRAAEEALARVLSEPGDPAGALVALDPRDGAVRAYVGGAAVPAEGAPASFDLAGAARRPAGSTFKPFVLAAAIEAGIPLDRAYPAPAEVRLALPDQPDWLVRNYDGRGEGNLDLVEATVRSVNTVYARLVLDVGAASVTRVAARMGVRSPLLAVPSVALGSSGVTVLDLASAYGTLAADGMHAPPRFVTRITAADGTVLWQAGAERRRALPAATARTLTGVLRQAVERGTGTNARIGRPVAGKTGTGEEWSDAWFVGYTPELAAAVWVGFPDALRTMRPPATRITVTGGSWPARVWQLFAGAALADRPASAFPEPAAPPTPTTTAPPAGRRPGERAVPAVVGMPGARARELLAEAGWGVRSVRRPDARYPPERVIAQTPAAGRPARPGTVVTLTLATRPRPVAVPMLLGLLPDEAASRLRGLGLEVVLRVAAESSPGDPGRAGRVWKQHPPAGTRRLEGREVRLWVNPA